MSQLTFFIIITTATLALSLKQTTTNDHFVLEGLDCRNPTKIASFLTRDWCTPTSTSRGDLPREKKTVTIVQDFKFQLVSGLRCTKQV